MVKQSKIIDIKAVVDGMRSATKQTLKESRFHDKQCNIKCKLCGEPRLIYVQDKYQVKLCRECQRKKRNARPKRSKPKDEKPVARRKKWRARREEPVIPEFKDRSEDQTDDRKLVL